MLDRPNVWLRWHHWLYNGLQSVNGTAMSRWMATATYLRSRAEAGWSSSLTSSSCDSSVCNYIQSTTSLWAAACTAMLLHAGRRIRIREYITGDEQQQQQQAAPRSQSVQLGTRAGRRCIATLLMSHRVHETSRRVLITVRLAVYSTCLIDCRYWPLTDQWSTSSGRPTYTTRPPVQSPSVSYTYKLTAPCTICLYAY